VLFERLQIEVVSGVLVAVGETEAKFCVTSSKMAKDTLFGNGSRD